MLNNLRTGIMYRNPRPHVKSVHAYFPSVVAFPDGELVATIVLGEAFESADLHTNVTRSLDQGETWELEGRLCEGIAGRLTSDAARICRVSENGLAAFVIRHDRTDHPDQGLTNHENLGFVPVELLLYRSPDRGRTWSEAEPIKPPLIGPAWEICAPITPLSDDRWLLPTQTWRAWDGECPNGFRMVAFVSHDRGKSWPEYLDVMRDPQEHALYWESKIIELPDGALLAAAWGYDEVAARDLPNQYTISRDGGRTWLSPRSTGILGQTMTPFLLKDGRLLVVYRRMDEPGLWATTVRLNDDVWVNLETVPLWGQRAAGLTATTANMAQNFNVLRFGAPCVVRCADGSIFVAFWCYEDCVSNIRWFRFDVDEEV